jgi:CRP-like cAMP-binding protein
MFSRMAAKAKAREAELTGRPAPAASGGRTDSYEAAGDDMFSRMAAKAKAREAELTGRPAPAASGERTDSYEAAGDDMFSRMAAKAKAREAELLQGRGASVERTSSQDMFSRMLAKAEAAEKTPSPRPAAKPAPKPRVAKKASALKKGSNRRSGKMPGQAVKGSTAVEEEEDPPSSDGEPWVDRYADVETPPTSDEEGTGIGDAGMDLFASMFGGDAAADKTDTPSPETGASSPKRVKSPTPSTTTSVQSDVHEEAVLEVAALKVQLEREESLKQDYQTTCKRLEGELEEMADEIEELTRDKDDLSEKLRALKQEDFDMSSPTARSGVDVLGSDGETATAMAKASSGMRTEDIWEGSAKFMALANRFGAFMSRQSEQNQVESCVVEFVFDGPTSELVGGLTEKAFKVSVNNQICQVLSLICSRLHLANAQSYEITTMRGFELTKDRNLASYGLGMLFSRWMLRLSLVQPPLGTDLVADTEMVRSLLYDHLDSAWGTIARHEEQRAAAEREKEQREWKEVDEMYAIRRRFANVSAEGRQRALAFLMMVEREEQMEREAASGGTISEGIPQPAHTKKNRQRLLSALFAQFPLLGNVDTAALVGELQGHMRLVCCSDGTRFQHKGDASSDAIFVAVGKVRLLHSSERDDDFVEAGGWLGERALVFGNIPANASAEAQGDVSLYHLSRPDVMIVLMKYPELHTMWLKLTQEMFSTSDESVTEGSAEERAELEMTRQFIDSVPMFHGLNPECVDALARRLTPISVAPNEVFITKGQVGQEMYFIVEGSAEMLPELDQAAFGHKGAGSFVGEMALLNSEPRNAFLRCVTKIEGFVLSKADLQHVLLEFPDMEAMVRQPIMERETQLAKEVGAMMATTATRLTRKERRHEAASTIQRAGKRFVQRRRDEKAEREALLAQLLANTQGGLETGLVNWEEVADARGQVRSVSFGDEQGVENAVWIDYNADLLAWEEVRAPSTLLWVRGE